MTKTNKKQKESYIEKEYLGNKFDELKKQYYKYQYFINTSMPKKHFKDSDVDKQAPKINKDEEEDNLDYDRLKLIKQLDLSP